MLKVRIWTSFSTGTGHRIGSTRDQAFAERADGWSFFLAVTGDPGFQPPPALREGEH